MGSYYITRKTKVIYRKVRRMPHGYLAFSHTCNMLYRVTEQRGNLIAPHDSNASDMSH